MKTSSLQANFWAEIDPTPPAPAPVPFYVRMGWDVEERHPIFGNVNDYGDPNLIERRTGDTYVSLDAMHYEFRRIKGPRRAKKVRELLETARKSLGYSIDNYLLERAGERAGNWDPSYGQDPLWLRQVSNLSLISAHISWDKTTIELCKAELGEE